jgi:hypothetical protein
MSKRKVEQFVAEDSDDNVQSSVVDKGTNGSRQSFALGWDLPAGSAKNSEPLASKDQPFGPFGSAKKSEPLASKDQPFEQFGPLRVFEKLFGSELFDVKSHPKGFNFMNDDSFLSLTRLIEDDIKYRQGLKEFFKDIQTLNEREVLARKSNLLVRHGYYHLLESIIANNNAVNEILQSRLDEIVVEIK